jgi:hypothetical protein
MRYQAAALIGPHRCGARARRTRALQLLVFLVAIRREHGAQHLGDAHARLLARVFLTGTDALRPGAAQRRELCLDA